MKISLNAQIFTGAMIGISTGIYLHTIGPDTQTAGTILYGCDIVGEIFIDLLKMILIPLVFTSIAVGIGNLKAHTEMQRIWKMTLIYFLATPAIAALLGLILVNAVKPGKGLEISMFQNALSSFHSENMTLVQFTKSFFANLFVDPIKAMAEGKVLPTVIFGIILGVALIVAGDRAKTIQKLLNEFFDIIMLIVSWVMRVAPFGIAALLAKLVATQNISLLSAMGKFIGVVIFGTLFHGIVILPLILYLFSGVGPIAYFKGMREALITALSTSSSSATLPVSLRCITQNFHVDRDIAGFIAPLGATVNMDGTALYEAVAAIFVANLVGVELNLIQQIVVFLTAILASIGAPGIPSAGMVTMVMVLQSVGLPAQAIAILIPIDRPLDAIRTAVNVEGDAICSVIVQNSISKNKAS